MTRAAEPLPFRRVAIAGLGLIGGSIAARLRRSAPAVRIAGVDTRPVLERARARGLVDDGCDTVHGLDADLVVLAAPIDATLQLMEQLAGSPATAPLVTDTCSIKRQVMTGAAGVPRFIGGHPMAGKEQSGLDHADADLFAGRPWLLVAANQESDDAQAVAAIVEALGAIPLFVDAAWHDRVMAYVSHLPQLLAVALMNAAGEACGEQGLAIAGRAFREMTRVASSPPDLWDGILRGNADNVQAALDELRAQLPSAGPDAAALHESFARARGWRTQLPSRPGPPS
jgi:prephenate dehydrogenase